MKEQRNVSQMKEQGRGKEKQLKEMDTQEIYILQEKNSEN